MQSRSLQYRGISVRFEQSDLSRRNDDALAISCDLSLTLNSPLCSAFVRLAGPQLQTAALNEVANYPQLYQYPPTPVAIRIPASGRLQTRNVILLPIGHTFGGLFTQLLMEMFNSAIQSGAQSLAFPPIGTGGFRLVNHYELSQAIFDALKAMPNFGSLTTITLITSNDYWTDQYFHSVNDLVIADQQNSTQANQARQAGNSTSRNNQPISSTANSVSSSVRTRNQARRAANSAAQNNQPTSSTANSASSSSRARNQAQQASNSTTRNNQPTSSIANNTSPPVQPQNSPFSSAYNVLDKKMVQELHSECLKDKQKEAASSSKNPNNVDDRLEACPVCLNDMLDNIDNYDEDSDMTIVQTVQCLHKFHRFCLTEWFRNKTTCPLCSTPCLDIRGNQPLSGFMVCHNDPADLPGFSGTGHIRIEYQFVDGIQTAEHPNPGASYRGTFRTCYLPNNAEGRAVRDMLQIAFDRRLTFTVGQSLTTGRQNVITWNGIHHKTSRVGGPTRFGYPDPTYLQRVKEELASYGITESLLT